MRRNRHKRLLLGQSKENLSQCLGTANILRATSLSRHAIPQLILLGEPMLNRPVREQVVDVAATTAVVTGVDADSFAEEFLDGRLEFRAVLGQVQVPESYVGGLQSACQWADIVLVWGVDSLFIYLLLPELICYERLGDTAGGEGRVCPACCAITAEFGPVALNGES